MALQFFEMQLFVHVVCGKKMSEDKLESLTEIVPKILHSYSTGYIPNVVLAAIIIIFLIKKK